MATLAIDSEIRFASAADRAAFARELSGTVKDLAARYHDAEKTELAWRTRLDGPYG